METVIVDTIPSTMQGYKYLNYLRTLMRQIIYNYS